MRREGSLSLNAPILKVIEVIIKRERERERKRERETETERNRGRKRE